MKVRELIEILEAMDQGAEVDIEVDRPGLDMEPSERWSILDVDDYDSDTVSLVVG